MEIEIATGVRYISLRRPHCFHSSEAAPAFHASYADDDFVPDNQYVGANQRLEG